MISSFGVPEGFSGRKLSAFFGVFISGFITAKYCTNESLNDILIIWLIFVAFCSNLIDFLTEKYLNKKENSALIADWDCKFIFIIYK